ncbi:MAG: site-2 protease family protein, partial [Anaerotignum sp.]|nr:site-2 protease family protein [Anaerotignum sp.]
QPGDVIRKINGQTIHIYDELSYMLQGNQGEAIAIEVLGVDGLIYKYELHPKLDEASGRYLIGFNPNVETGLFADPVDGYGTMSVGETMHYSLFSMFNYVKMTAEGLVRVFTFTAEKDEYGGPIAIFKTVETSYEAGLKYSVIAALQNVIYIGAVLSANLGVLNLFPIPALDGGKILFLLIEAIRKKPMEPELEGKLQFLGFMFIMGLMVYVLFSDIMKFII